MKKSTQALELRNVKFYEKLSEETNCYTADLYANGKLVATVRNDGHGGETDVRQFSPKVAKEFAAIEAYCKLLPYKTFGDLSYPVTLDVLADDLFEEWVVKRERSKVVAKLDKLTVNHIVILNREKWDDFLAGKNANLSYKHIKLKADLVSYSPKVMREYIKKVQLEPSEFIYNDLSFMDMVYESVVDIEKIHDWKLLRGAIEKNSARLDEIDQKAKSTGSILYRWFDRPVADGKATYQVVRIQGKKALVYLCEGICPDNYFDALLGAESWVDLKLATDLILGRDKIKELFSKKKATV